MEPGISESYFRHVINDFRAAKILQGTSTLYITPKLLHVWLWTEWWTVGTAERYWEIWRELPERLRGWFTDMLAYAQEAPRAVGAIQTLFAPDGPLHSIPDGPAKVVATLFFHAALVAPDSALSVLEHDLGRRSIEELREFENGRHAVVRALERIAQRSEYFERAAMLLLTLAEAENERYSNNATGTFKELFGLGYGPLAPSDLPPTERLPFLLRVLRSGTSAQRRLALDAFENALRTHRVRSGDLDLHGLRRNEALWRPTTYAELYETYITYWRAFFDVLPLLASEDRERAVHVLLDKIRPMCHLPLVSQVVVDTLEAAVDQNRLPHAELVEEIDQIVAYDQQKIDAAVLRRLEDLRFRLRSDFAARLHRYVRLRSITDEFDEQRRATYGKTAGFERLVEEVLTDPPLIEPHFHWLVTESVRNGYNFGSALAQRDPEATLFWPKIRDSLVTAASDANDFFVGGYLAGVFSQRVERWEALITELVDCGVEKRLIVHLIWRSGMSPRIAELISNWVHEHSISAAELGLFTYGGQVRNVPEGFLIEWLELLLAQGTRSAALTALEMASFRLEAGETNLPDDLVERILVAPSLFGESGEDADRASTMGDYHWKLLADRWAGEDPNRLVRLTEALLSAFENSGSIFRDGDGTSAEVMENAFRAAPHRSWRVVSALISKDADRRRAWEVERWLRGGEGSRRKTAKEEPINLLPREAMLAWVSESPSERAPQVASFTPPVWDADNWQGSLARTLLVNYGENRDVRAALSSSYFTEGWWGPASLHYRERLEQISAILASETNSNARRWLNELRRSLNDQIEAATVEEERWY